MVEADEGASKRRGILDGEKRRVAEFSQTLSLLSRVTTSRIFPGLKNFDCLVKD